MATRACLDLAARTHWSDENEYPLFYWPQHVEIAVQGSTEGTIGSLDDFLVLDGEDFAQWAEAISGMTGPGSQSNEENKMKISAACHKRGNRISPVVLRLPTYPRRLLSGAPSLKILGVKALSLACDWQKIENVRILLQAGVDFNAYYDYGDGNRTTLMTAVATGNVEIVELLLVNGSNIDIRDYYGYSALRYAIEHGQVEVASLLLEEGGDWTPKDDRGKSLLEAAAESCHGLEVAQLLLEKGACYRETFGNAFRLAAERGYGEMVTLFASFARQIGAPESDYSDAWSAASKTGHVQDIRVLLERGTQIDAAAFDFLYPSLRVPLLLVAHDTCNVFYAGSAAYKAALLAANWNAHPEFFQLLLGYDTEGVCTPGNAIFDAILHKTYDHEARCLSWRDEGPNPGYWKEPLTEIMLTRDVSTAPARSPSSGSCTPSRAAVKILRRSTYSSKTSHQAVPL
ncbi:hypothetical protein TI39_contig414g00006 [Zymoseptoria brevis]|uniref:Uncharacterized protein n=1 Tax=Zymoseptoria brevis TaxID=1047168 RepID=A0A0F4GQB1_9PEZI|nr:hypothetical protein TI39_contig414g00006 [Zymoseptoria brevis]